MLYNSRIEGVRFQLAGTENIEAESVVRVTSHDLFRGDEPYPEGPHDAHLGTISHLYRCDTCYNSTRKCVGHSGHIVLNYPVWNPMVVNEGKRWLKLICFKCGNPIIAESKYTHLPAENRLEEASKIARNGNKQCVHCGEPRATLKKDPTEHLAITAVMVDERGNAKEPVTIYPHDIERVFSRVTDKTVTDLGRHPDYHPRYCILRSIRVPTSKIRPDVKKIGGGRSNNDDLTTMLQIISKKNSTMPPIIPDIIDKKLAKNIFELNNDYYEFVRANGEGGMTSITLRLKGKQGRLRKNLLGKRVVQACRTTIVGTPRRRIDELDIPMSFAKTIQLTETVQEYNIARLTQYVQNGLTAYPGATEIVKGTTGATYDVSRYTDLEIGDEVHRDVITGDPVDFGRQPSLMVSNISTHRVVVVPDPTYRTIGMNQIVTKYYNADFDGDAMCLNFNTSYAGRNELQCISAAPNWFVSHAKGTPSIGQMEDSIVGMAELTRSDVTYDRYHAMMLFQNTNLMPAITEETLSGRDCVSMTLVDTPINFSRTANWYQPSLAAFIPYDPSEIRVVIEHGKIQSGILDKKSIGAGSNGGIYHIIANEYSNAKAFEAIYVMQQMAISHTMLSGYSIGIQDLVIPRDVKNVIDKIASDIMNKSNLITEEMRNGELIPPIGSTLEEFHEKSQINTLTIFDDFTEPILRAINPRTNNLLKLILYGSKGLLENMLNMVSMIGQKLINGERIRQQFGYKRTLAYFPRFDTSPQSRGYITNSYLGGMSSCEFVFNAMAARFDLISKALSTSVTGEQHRKSMKNLESLITNYFRMTIKSHNIVQFAYGEDYLDPRKVELVKFPTVMISTDAFESRYSHKSFPDFFAAMSADRDMYRGIFTNVELINIRELMTDERRMPVNVERIIVDVLAAHGGQTAAPAEDTLAKMVEYVDKLCANIPYILINEIQERNGTPIPDVMRAATVLLQMLIRSHLHPNALVSSKMTMPLLTVIGDRIRTRYAQALVDPGTAVGTIAAMAFSEPLTQYMLDAHTRSATGGTSKSGMTGAKEVLGARQTHTLHAPSMLLTLAGDRGSLRATAQEAANQIEMVSLRQFLSSLQIFYEKYKTPEHPAYVHESAIIAQFETYNPLLRPPADLLRWCIRLVIDKSEIILKNMAVEAIVNRLRDLYPDVFIVYTPENAKQIILRVYMRNVMFKGAVTLAAIKEFKDRLLSTVIRGINGVQNANVVKMVRNKVNADGSIGRDDNLWGVQTVGTNLNDIMSCPLVDPYLVQTTAIQEIRDMFGIEAARQAVVSALRNLVDVCNHRHYIMYADEMCYTGRVTSIEAAGLRQRESSNILLLIGFSSPLVILENAAVDNASCEVTGMTAPLLVGSIPRHGTLYTAMRIDADFVRANTKKTDDLLDELI